MSVTPEQQRWKSIEIGTDHVAFDLEGKRQEFKRTRLPPEFLEWIKEGRLGMYNMLEGNAGSAGFFASHLPVVITYSPKSAFPFNTGNKGVGLIPVPEAIDDYCERYQRVLEQNAHRAWDESLKERLNCVREFISGGAVSDEALVTLEIFERNTFHNLCENPIAALHYTGDGPVYRSYQINVVVQIVSPEHPIYQFVFLSRQLFEYDSFHITQTQFPYAYVFYPIEVKDKTPFPRREGLKGFPTPKSWDSMMLVWHEDVLEQLIRAPEYIQKFIIKLTEEYAREHGHTEVNLPMFNAIRSRYMGKKDHSM